MASIPEYLYSPLDYTLFSTDLSGLPTPAAADGGAAAMWGTSTTSTTDHDQEFMVPLFYGGTGTSSSSSIGLETALSSLSSSPTDSLVSSSSFTSAVPIMASSTYFPEQIAGVSDGVVPTGTEMLFSDYMRNYNMIDNLHGISSGVQNFGAGYNNNNHGFVEFREECCATSFLPEFNKPTSLVAGEKNWIGMQSNQMHAIEDSNMMKVGRYSEEERKERIVRYLKKRNQRNFNKTIKYACRKTLADRRVRVRGRFARNNELYHHDHEYQQMVAKRNELDHHTRKQIDFCCDDDVIGDAIQIKYDDEEEWLQDFALCCWGNGGN